MSYSNEKQDADIVLFGDSTVATNVDPIRMSRDLHLKVIALPNVSTSLPVSGYAPLEHYLQRNKPPRLIVFYLSGWDLDFLHNPFTEIVEEGEEMLLLHGSSKEVIHYAILHPRKAIMFSLHFYGNTNRIGDLLHFRKHETPSLDRGHILLLSHPTPMKPNCAFDMALVNKGQGDASSRESLIHFTTPETQTMVVVSPVPACKQLDKVTSMPHEGLQLPPVLVLPPSSFREDGWQAHILTGKIGPATDSLETLIREKLTEGAGVTSKQ